MTFRKILAFYGGELLAPEAREPPLVGCPPPLVEYIISYRPHTKAFSARKLRTLHDVVTRGH